MTLGRRLFAAALLAGLAACSNAIGGGDPKAAIARGEQALANGEARTARIEFLNAIKAEPGNPRLRLLQAETYLELGDAVAAEAELRRARQLGAPPARTHHLLAHAYLLQGRYEEAVREAQTGHVRHAAYAARIRGQAQMKLGDVAGAADAFAAAVAAAPREPAVWMDVARYRRSIGDAAGALAAADKAVRLRPGSVEALTLRGELTRNQYGPAAALSWLDRALEIDGEDDAARLERAATLGDMGRTAEMLADTREVLKTTPGNSMAYYLQAVLAARAGRFELARSLHQKSRGVMDSQPAGMLLGGAIELQTGAVQQAASRLERLVAMQPENRKARRLLGSAFWKLGDADATVRTLQPIADRMDADSYSLTLLAKAHRKEGDVRRASQLLARAAQPQVVTPPALLTSAASGASSQVQLEIETVSALLSQGEHDEALDRALRLQAEHPGAANAHLLVGDVLELRGDHSGAAEHYRNAANLSFAEPAAMRLIYALRRSGRHAAAAKVLQLFLEQNPRNVPAMLLAANSFMELEKWSEAISLYEGLRSRLGDRDAALLNNLAHAYGQRAQFERAVPIAGKAWRLDKNNPATAGTLGWLLFKSGKDRARGLAMVEQASRGAPTDKQIQAHLNQAKKS